MQGQQAAEKTSEATEAAKQKASETTQATKEKASETAQAAKEKASGTTQAAKEKTQETAQAAKEKTQETTEAAKEKAQETTQAAKETVSRHSWTSMTSTSSDVLQLGYALNPNCLAFYAGSAGNPKGRRDQRVCQGEDQGDSLCRWREAPGAEGERKGDGEQLRSLPWFRPCETSSYLDALHPWTDSLEGLHAQLLWPVQAWKTAQKAGETKESLKEQASETLEKAKEKAEQLKEGAKQTTEEAKKKAQETSQKAAEEAKRTKGTAKEEAERTKKEAEERVRCCTCVSPEILLYLD